METKCFVNGCFGTVKSKWIIGEGMCFSCNLHQIAGEDILGFPEPFEVEQEKAPHLYSFIKTLTVLCLLISSIIFSYQYLETQHARLWDIEKDIKFLKTASKDLSENTNKIEDIKKFVLNSYYENDFSLFLNHFVNDTKKAITNFEFWEPEKNISKREVFIILSNQDIDTSSKVEFLYKHFFILFEEFESEILTITPLDTDTEILYGTMGGAIHYLDMETQSHILVHQGKSRIYQIVPYNNYQLAIVTGDSQINIMSLYDFEYRQSFIAHQHWILSSKFSPDGQLLATGSCDKLIKLWNTTSMKEMFTLSAHKGEIWSLHFNHNSKLLASAGEDKALIVWDLDSRSQYQTFYGHKGPIYSIQFTKDSKFLVTGSGDGTIRIWKLLDRSFETLSHKGMVRSILLSHSDKYLFTIASKSLKIWDFSTRTLLAELLHTSNLISLSLSYDKTYILTGDVHNRLWVWDFASYNLKNVFGGSKSNISRIQISEDFQWLAISDIGIVRVYNLLLNKQMGVLQYKEQVKTWKIIFNLDSFLPYLSN